MVLYFALDALAPPLPAAQVQIILMHFMIAVFLGFLRFNVAAITTLVAVIGYLHRVKGVLYIAGNALK